MKRMYFVSSICILIISSLHPQELEIYGYFEPQFMGLYQDGDYYQLNANKLRIDIKSSVFENIEFGANVNFTLYFGKRNWDLLDFLPDNLVSSIPQEMNSFFQFTYRDTFSLDNVYTRISIARFALTVGKQQISLGTAYFSNPTDILNIKDVFDPTYEQPGHNAIRLDLFLGSRLSITALYTPIEEDWEKSGKLLRIKAGVGHFDFSIMGYETQHTSTDYYTFQMTQQRRRIIGLDFVGELFGLGVWGEGIYNFLEDDDDFYEFIVGSDYTFESGLYALWEYHRNSKSKACCEEYDLNDWLWFFTGEIKTISRDQVYGFISYPATYLMSFGCSIIASISDGSVALVPTVEYSIFENVDLTLMANLYIGEEGKVYSSTMGNGCILRGRVYF